MNKIERIDKEIAKTREKITEYQNKLRGLEAQKTEAENLQIVYPLSMCVVTTYSCCPFVTASASCFPISWAF